MDYLDDMIDLILKKEPDLEKTRLSLKSGGQSFLISSIYKGKQVVLKIPAIRGKDSFLDDYNISSLENEIKFFSMLNGINNLAKIYSSGYIASNNITVPYLILKEYDRTLDREIEFLTAEKVLDYAWGLFQGIKNIHQRGIVHRDIKTTNCLIDDSTYSLVIADFGIARKFDPFNIYADRIYTKELASPEQIKGICVPQIDIWGAATVYLSLLMGININQIQDKNDFISDLRYEFVHFNEGPNTSVYYNLVSSRFADLAYESINLFRRAFAFNWEERADINEIISIFETIKKSRI